MKTEFKRIPYSLPKGLSPNKTKTRSKNLIRLLQLVPIVIPILVCFWYIRENAVNVAYWDDWHFFHELIKIIDSNQINLPEFINSGGGEFKVPVAHAILLSVLYATKFNVMATICAQIILLSLTCVCTLAIAWPILKNENFPLLLFSPVLWLILSLRQWDILLWDGAMPAVASVFFFVLTLYLLSRSHKFDFWLMGSIVSATLATYSCGSGVLTWPIGLLQILLKPTPTTSPAFKQATATKNQVTNQDIEEGKELQWHRWCLQIGAWCITGLITLCLYTRNLSPGSLAQKQAHLTIDYLKTDFVHVIEFALAFLGSPLSNEPNGAIAIGSLLLILAAISTMVSLLQRDSNERVAAIAPSLLIVFGILITCLSVLGRVRVGLPCALKSYYCVFSNLTVIGIYLLMLVQKRTKPFYWSTRMGVLVGLLLLGTIISIRSGLKEGERIRGSRIVYANMVRSHDWQSNESLSELCNSIKIVSDDIAFLERNHLNLFEQPPHPPISSLKRSTKAPCFLLESINSFPSHTYPLQKHIVVDSKKDKTLDFRGWAIDFKSRSPCGDVFVTIDNQLDIPTGMGIPRTEVCNRFRRHSYRNSGFGGTCKTDLLSKGLHIVTLKLVSPDYQEYFQSGPLASLEIK